MIYHIIKSWSGFVNLGVENKNSPKICIYYKYVFKIYTCYKKQ